MKLSSFTINGRTSYGAIEGGMAFEAPEALRNDCPDLKTCIAAGRTAEARGATGIPLDQIVALPPIPNADKYLCIGVNYKLHIEETGRTPPENPSVFTKLPNTIVGHDSEMSRPRASQNYDYEGELAVIIGKGGRYIAKEDAMNHVFGWSCFNDGSIRDFQKHSVTAGKNFPRTGGFGPWIVTRDEAPEPAEMVLTTHVNDQEVQKSGVNMLIFDVPTIIAYLSTFQELCPGDVIATGTPSGVGARREPPLWLKPGDSVMVTISGVGSLSNTVKDE